MVMIANPQVAFSIFVLTEAWLVPLEGWPVDRFGPRNVVLAGGLLIGLASAVNSMANSLTLLYLGAVLGGVGCVYGTCMGNALKWFLDRRGLPAILAAAS
jgi:MFS transporter, OFA family, oxalate/formate antiporter